MIHYHLFLTSLLEQASAEVFESNKYKPFSHVSFFGDCLETSHCFILHSVIPSAFEHAKSSAQVHCVVELVEKLPETQKAKLGEDESVLM